MLKRFKAVSIFMKIFGTVITIFVVVGAIYLLNFQSSVTEMVSRELERNLEAKALSMDNNLSRIGKKALAMSALQAGLPVVKEAYRRHYAGVERLEATKDLYAYYKQEKRSIDDQLNRGCKINCVNGHNRELSLVIFPGGKNDHTERTIRSANWRT